MIINNRKGSLTVEASLVLPIFISAVLSLAFFIRMVYVQEFMQHAISEAAEEMACSAYIFHISGLQGLHDAVRDGIDSKAEISQNQLSSMFDLYNDLKGLSGITPDSHTGDVPQDKTGDNIKGYSSGSIISSAESIFKDLKSFVESGEGTGLTPLNELKSVAALIAQGAFEDIKTELCIPLVKLTVKKYLEKDEDMDKTLRKMSIVGGYDGLDFSESSFFENNNDIDIVVKYKLDIPVPFKVLRPALIMQRATARAWVGDIGTGNPGGQIGEGSVWELGNFDRGKKIRAAFGGNLPEKYPVIASFRSGTATMIKSMDLTARYYQASKNVEDKVDSYVKELVKFKGANREGVKILESQLMEKRIILVIPENEVKPEIMNTLDRCAGKAARNGIRIEIIKYQTKKLESGAGRQRQE